MLKLVSTHSNHLTVFNPVAYLQTFHWHPWLAQGQGRMPLSSFTGSITRSCSSQWSQRKYYRCGSFQFLCLLKQFTNDTLTCLLPETTSISIILRLWGKRWRWFYYPYLLLSLALIVFVFVQRNILVHVLYIHRPDNWLWYVNKDNKECDNILGSMSWSLLLKTEKNLFDSE